jgi:signal transduction histidine kinase
MSLPVKTLIIIFSTLLGLFIVLYGFSRAIVLRSYEQLEAQNMQQNVESVLNAVTNDLQLLSGVNADWAYWSSTYDFMSTNDPAYIADNISDRTFTDLDIEAMAFISTEGQPVFIRYEDAETREEIPVPDDLSAYFTGDSPFINYASDDDSVSGIVLTDAGAMMLVSRAILTSDSEGPSRGTLIFGRLLTEDRIAALSESLNIQLTGYVIEDNNIPAAVAPAYTTLVSQPGIYTQPQNNFTVSGYGLIRDIHDQPAFILQADLPRSIYQQGETTLLYFSGALLIAGLVFGAATLILLRQFVLSRLAFLNTRLREITDSANLQERINMPGGDELSGLANTINGMISALEQAQNKMSQARDQAMEALRLKDQILANVSYDLRTPLNVVLTRTEMVQRGIYGPVTTEQNRMLETVTSSGRHLLNFVNNLLEAGQLNAGTLELNHTEFTPQELLEVVETAMLPLARSKGLNFTTGVGENVPSVIRGDQERLEQIALNLMDNAIKYTDQGDVSIWIQRPDEDHWAIQVADTGMGIADDAKGQLFESFWQLDPQSDGMKSNVGFGLGLSIVGRFARLMNGRVNIESIVNSGSIFTVILPLDMNREEAGYEQSARTRR